MFDSGRSYFLGRSHIRLAPIDHLSWNDTGKNVVLFDHSTIGWSGQIQILLRKDIPLA